MKKIILTLTLLLIICASFPLAVSASGDGSSFDTAIQLPPLDTRTNSEYTNAGFDRPGQAVYFTFTSNESGYYEVYSRGSITFDVFDAERELVSEGSKGGRRAQLSWPGSMNGYIRVMPAGDDYNINFRIMIVDGAYGAIDAGALWEAVTQYWWVLVLILLYVAFFAFFYRSYLQERYGFDPLGGVFKLSLVLSVAVLILGFMGIIMYSVHTYMILIAAAAVVITSIMLFVKSKSIISLIIYAILMSGFYAAFILVAVLAAIIAFFIAGLWFFFSVYAGSNPGADTTRRCASCGQNLGNAVQCGCGRSNAR